ncbi:hypothetical protein L1887_55795 [Cichorium endivia]|nr:hypothetical protein L1887_55795 [Cichorium endivia]
MSRKERLAAASALLVVLVDSDRVWVVGVEFGLCLLLEGRARDGLEGLLDVDGLLCARLKVGDVALGLAPRHGALLRDHALALLDVDLVAEHDKGEVFGIERKQECAVSARAGWTSKGALRRRVLTLVHQRCLSDTAICQRRSEGGKVSKCGVSLQCHGCVGNGTQSDALTQSHPGSKTGQGQAVRQGWSKDQHGGISSIRNRVASVNTYDDLEEDLLAGGHGERGCCDWDEPPDDKDRMQVRTRLECCRYVLAVVTASVHCD